MAPQLGAGPSKAPGPRGILRWIGALLVILVVLGGGGLYWRSTSGTNPDTRPQRVQDEWLWIREGIDHACVPEPQDPRTSGQRRADLERYTWMLVGLNRAYPDARWNEAADQPPYIPGDGWIRGLAASYARCSPPAAAFGAEVDTYLRAHPSTKPLEMVPNQ
jgi:hypothetical protein